MKVKPRPGLIVRDPISRIPLPVAGADVPESEYWVRRLLDGDVVGADDVPVKSAPVKEG